MARTREPAPITFKVSAADRETITKIVCRAKPLYESISHPFDPLALSMDLHAVHANGCPLRLDDPGLYL